MKLIKFILCAAILASSLTGVYAAEDSGALEALKLVKERIDTSEYDEFKSTYYKDENGKTTYSFSWSKSSDSYSELYVLVENGIIKNYGKYKNFDSEGENKLSLSKEDALKIADEFIKRANPDIYGNIKAVSAEEQSVMYNTYTVDLYRTEGGIPVLYEAGGIEISKQTGEVSSFYISYDKDIKFAALDGIMSADDAKKAYKELAPLTLRYKYKTDYEKKQFTPYIEYALNDDVIGINAVDGSLYKGDNYGYFHNYAKEESRAAADNAGGLSPAELEETEKIAGLLSEEQAEQAIRQNKIIGVSKDFTVSHISFNRDSFDKDVYSYNFDFERKDEYIGVNIDAKTGEILSFYKYDDKEFKDNQNRKREENSAKAAFSALAGDKVSEFRMQEEEYNGEVSFVRTYDGLDVIGDGAYFDFDGDDNIRGYSLTYRKNTEFPSKEGVISAEAALESAFDSLGFELGYAVNYETKTAQPVYYIGKNAQAQSFTMNPFTAKITDYKGDDAKSNTKIVYSDIENHYGKDIFLKLAEYGVGFDGGALKPDEPITQSEYFAVLNKAFGYEEDIEGIYRSMINQGILPASERADDSVLTRENAAIFMIREMGAERYAKFDDIFTSPFDDVTENKGYIAILKAEKVINGDGSGNFYPKKTVTRGEALIMIYNYFMK